MTIHAMHSMVRRARQCIAVHGAASELNTVQQLCYAYWHSVVEWYHYNICYIWYTIVNKTIKLFLSTPIYLDNQSAWYLSCSKLGEKQKQTSNVRWAYLHVTAGCCNVACTLPHIHILYTLLYNYDIYCTLFTIYSKLQRDIFVGHPFMK